MEHAFYLFALPLLFLPWLIRRLRPPKPRQIAFSQMYILEQVARNHPFVKRRENIWLIILRMLTLLTLILLACGFFDFNLSSTSGRRSAIFLVNDTLSSFSKNEKEVSIWESEQEKIQIQIAKLHAQAEVALLGFSGRVWGWMSPNQLETELEKIEPLYRGENWSDARRHLRELVKSRQQTRLSFFVLGDGRYESPEGFKGLARELPDITQVEDLQTLDEPLPNTELRAEVQAFGDGVLLLGEIYHPQKQTGTLRLLGENQKLLEQKIDLSKESPTAFRIEAPYVEFKKGVLELLTKDAFAPDNRFFYATQAGGRVRVMLFQERSSQKRLKDMDYYLQKGFNSLATEFELLIEERDPRHRASFDNGHVDVVILNELSLLSEDEANALKSFVQRGGQLVILAGPLSQPEALENYLLPLLPAQLKEPIEGDFKLSLEKEDVQLLPRFSKSSFRGRWLFYHLNNNTRVRFRFSDGAPFWLQRSWGQGEVHLLSSAFHLAWSDALVLSDLPSFLRLLLFEAGSRRAFEPELKLTTGEKAPKELSALRPLLNTPELSAEQALVPGLYEALPETGISLLLAANLPTGSFKKRDLAKLPSSRSAIENLSEEKQRFDLFFATLLALLLLAEAFFLYRRQALA